jgi:hypothetical protein
MIVSNTLFTMSLTSLSIPNHWKSPK